MENTNEAILVIQDGMVKFVNANTLMSFGYTEKELSARSIFDFIHPEDRQTVIMRYRQEIEGDPRPTRNAYRIIHKSGDIRWIEISSVLIQWQGRPATLNLITDITERKQSEEALRSSEERFRVLTEMSPLGMALMNTEGRYEYLNPAFVRMFGYTLDDIPTGSDWLTRAYPDPEYRREVIAAWKEDMTGVEEGSATQRTFRVTCKDGSEKTVLFKPVVNMEGKQLILCEDITERVKAEEERARLRAQLLQAQKMEALGALAGGIAHDFNNILAAVIGYVELAQLDTDKNSRTAHYLAQIMKAGERARDLVKRILAFARRVEPGVKPTRLGLVVKEAINLLRASLPATIEIRQMVETERDTIMGDPGQIHQVIMNLATNAAHAMGEPGGILEVSVDEEEISDRQNYPEISPGRFVRLRVRDTGCGMSREIMERIFDPYFTTKKAGVGTGLGLAVVNGIVREHKGAIRVESSPGEGTTFAVLFPVLEEELISEMAEQEETLRGEGSILFVDDEEMIVEMAKGMLEHLGYRVCGMTDSLRALDAFKADPKGFDVVVTDMTMPRMTGDILARELLKIRPELPIIACTGFSERMSDEKAAGIGIRALLMKPLTVRDMAKTIKEVIGTGNKR